MKILNVSNRNQNFCAEQKKLEYDANPISKAGEEANLFKATVVVGLGFGARALLWLYDEGFLGEEAGRISSKLVNKNNKDVTGTKKTLLHIGGFAAVTLGFVGVMAALYTLVKTPEIMYKGKVNAFVKGKDMDVYIKGNKVEKELYNQMNEKAKNATTEEKKVLAQQYLKLKAAKNQTPEFVQTK